MIVMHFKETLKKRDLQEVIMKTGVINLYQEMNI